MKVLGYAGEFEAPLPVPFRVQFGWFSTPLGSHRAPSPPCVRSSGSGSGGGGEGEVRVGGARACVGEGVEIE
eukprot:8307802-Alexandrium_andersonii.AAC.1